MNRDSSAGKRRWPAVLFFCIAAVLLVFLSLPYIVEHVILPPLLAKAGFSGYRAAVSRFGPAGATFHITAAPEGAEFRTGSIELGWTIPGLLGHRLNRVVLNGFRAEISLPLERESPAAEEAKPSGSVELPVIVENIQVVNSTVLLRTAGRAVSWPVTFSGSLQAAPGESDRDLLRYRTELRLAQQSMSADFSFEPPTGKLNVNLQAKLFLSAVADFLPRSSPVTECSGTADLTGGAAFALNPFTFDNLAFEITFDQPLVAGKNFSLEALDNERPWITLTGSADKYTVNGSGLGITRPLRAALDLNGEMTVADPFHWQAGLIARPAALQQLAAGWVLESAPEISLQYSDGRDSEKKIVLRSAGGSGPASFVIRRGEKRFGLDTLTLEGRPAESSPRAGDTPELRFSLVAENLQLDSGDIRLRIPAISLQGKAAYPPVADPSQWPVAGILRLGDGSLDLPDKKLHLEGIQLFLPVQWPGREKPDAGDYRIGSLQYQQNPLGFVAGELSQSGRRLSLHGKFMSRLLPETPVQIDGNLEVGQQGLPRLELTFAAPESRLAVADIAAFYPELSAVTGSAQLDVKGSIRYDSCGLDGEMSTRLSGGNFALPAAHFALEDVRLDIHVPSLHDLATDPAQQISIGTLRSNQVAVSDIQALFRLESPQSLLIERLSGKWAGGRIFSSSFRLHKDLQKLELALFCDRLELAQILSQFKLADAGGQGRLSGRVPLFYDNGKFFVDDGFLFTSPGEQGILKIRKSEYLAVGVPTDVPQFSPLHFAGAALRDFEYNWAKLNIYSEEENLLLKLQIDGRPGEKLPYRFDPASNAFVRLQDTVSMGMDQPVKLDVNFKVPVNELFKYQKGIMPFLRNLK